MGSFGNPWVGGEKGGGGLAWDAGVWMDESIMAAPL
jgi:hypothetical protein